VRNLTLKGEEEAPALKGEKEPPALKGNVI
jgi:hypothetical protein